MLNHHAEQLAVVCVLVVCDIKPEKTHIPGETPQVPVGDKSQMSRYLYSFVRTTRVSVCDRINVYFFGSRQGLIKPNRPVIEQD